MSHDTLGCTPSQVVTNLCATQMGVRRSATTRKRCVRVRSTPHPPDDPGALRMRNTILPAARATSAHITSLGLALPSRAGGRIAGDERVELRRRHRLDAVGLGRVEVQDARAFQKLRQALAGDLKVAVPQLRVDVHLGDAE